jgi:hypothetical protein
MSSHVRILGIARSLRRGSYNQAALCAAKLERNALWKHALMLSKYLQRLTRP